MPWHVARSDDCPEDKPWAVIKDDDESVVGCHASEDDAAAQVAALYANEKGARTMARLITGIREEKVLPLSRVQVKADDESGLITEMTGYVAAFDNVDDGGDIILKGAFARTISERVAAGKVKLMADHIWDTEHTMGTWQEASEDDYGLLFRSDVDPDPQVQRWAGKAQRGTVSGMSIGYEAMGAVQPTPEQQQLGAMRVLTEVKVFEGSLLPFGMNENAYVIGAKGDPSTYARELSQAHHLLTAAVRHSAKAGRRNAAHDEARIRSALSLLEELLDSVGDDPTTDSDEGSDGKAASARLVIAQGMIAARRYAQLSGPHD